MRFFDMTENPRFAAPVPRAAIGSTAVVRVGPQEARICSVVRTDDIRPGDVVWCWDVVHTGKARRSVVTRTNHFSDDVNVFTTDGEFMSSEGNAHLIERP